jgi:hypothetical protein
MSNRVNNLLLWLCIVGLCCLTVYNKANEYRPPEKPKDQRFLQVPAGKFEVEGQPYSAILQLFADGTTGWSAQPVEEKPVLQLK